MMFGFLATPPSFEATCLQRSVMMSDRLQSLEPIQPDPGRVQRPESSFNLLWSIGSRLGELLRQID